MARLVSHASVSSGNGITLRYRGKRIVLDPVRPPSADLVFVSHAHIDHMPVGSGTNRILTSRETAYLASKRGVKFGETFTDLEGYELYDSGHILGSKGLLVDGEIFYTGDFSTRPRAFLKAGKIPSCHTLIVESTYGRPEYVFPSAKSVAEQVNRLISEMYEKGIPVVLMGYPLGKAQVLSHLFSSWEPIYVHADVSEMNRAHSQLGVPVGSNFEICSGPRGLNRLSSRPWVLISPVYSPRADFIRRLKNEYGAITIAFTGWSIEPGYRHAMGADYSFPLSDHCDFNDLVKLVEASEPEKVYTVHGFAAEFSNHLRKLGYDAEPLIGSQRSMSEFVGED